MTPRAAPLPPDQRRDEIVRAARPLLLEHGGRFTTRQVAEAAGIAEGTLFRVFPTKRELMTAVIGHLMDPTELCHDLDAIDPALPLVERVGVAMARMQQDIDDISAIFRALFTMPTDDVRQATAHDGHAEQHNRPLREQQAAMLHQALVRVLQPDADRLACSTDEAASLVRSMAFATSHPHLSDGRLTDPARVSALLLGGIAPAAGPREHVTHPSSPTASTPASTSQETSC